MDDCSEVSGFFGAAIAFSLANPHLVDRVSIVRKVMDEQQRCRMREAAERLYDVPEMPNDKA